MMMLTDLPVRITLTYFTQIPEQDEERLPDGVLNILRGWVLWEDPALKVIFQSL